MFKTLLDFYIEKLHKNNFYKYTNTMKSFAKTNYELRTTHYALRTTINVSFLIFYRSYFQID